MRILFICGSYPPQMCGVGDYLSNLITSLEKRPDIEILLFTNRDWRIKNIFTIIKEIKNLSPDIIHIQYPSNGFGLSLLPQLISLRLKTVITLHEVSHSKFMRKLSLFFFSFRSDIIFTNIFEKSMYKKYYLWYRGKTAIIPIGSNIKKEDINNSDSKIKNKIISFGQIRPKKGIEDVIKLAKLIEKYKLNYKVVIIGQLLDKFSQYYWELKNTEGAKYVTWELNLNEAEVNNHMKNSLIAYFPFPDGASERRGSLLAAMNNNMVLFTTEGPQTTDEMKAVVTIVKDPSELITYLLNNSDELQEIARERKPKMDNYLRIRGWDNIANLHMDYYKFLINK